jgi:hypothetical protein
MSGLLSANGPFPAYADKLMMYGQFVGSWKIAAIWFTQSGESRNGMGEWHFDWILGGLGIQDVLFSSGATPEKFGTTIRCYDSENDIWHLTWMQPSGGEFVHLIGRNAGDRIIQEGRGTDPNRRIRWSFNEVTASSFIWLGEVSSDDGKSWFLEQKMTAIRI